MIETIGGRGVQVDYSAQIGSSAFARVRNSVDLQLLTMHDRYTVVSAHFER